MSLKPVAHSQFHCLDNSRTQVTSEQAWPLACLPSSYQIQVAFLCSMDSNFSGECMERNRFLLHTMLEKLPLLVSNVFSIGQNTKLATKQSPVLSEIDLFIAENTLESKSKVDQKQRAGSAAVNLLVKERLAVQS